MPKIRKWLPVAVTLALVCASSSSGASAAQTSQTDTSSAAPAAKPVSTASKPSTARKSSKKRRTRRAPMPKAPTPDRISEIQTALSHGGYYQGDSNGKWDSNTVAAVQKFQSANDLDAT